jgi:hypothetical protein
VCGYTYAMVNEDDYKRHHDCIYSSALLFIAQNRSGHLSGKSTVGKRVVGIKPMRADKLYLCRIHMYTINIQLYSIVDYTTIIQGYWERTRTQ